jgi:hypothetical protein
VLALKSSALQDEVLDLKNLARTLQVTNHPNPVSQQRLLMTRRQPDQKVSQRF